MEKKIINTIVCLKKNQSLNYQVFIEITDYFKKSECEYKKYRSVKKNRRKTRKKESDI